MMTCTLFILDKDSTKKKYFCVLMRPCAFVFFFMCIKACQMDATEMAVLPSRAQQATVST